MKRAKTLPDLQAQFNQIKTAVAGDTKFSATALLFLVENMPLGSDIRRLNATIEGLRKELLATRKAERALVARIKKLEADGGDQDRMEQGASA